MTRPPDGDGYQGPATLLVGNASFEVEADLRGKFEPIDGHYHWYGRLGRHDGLAAAVIQGRAKGTLSTPDGTAECEVSDPDQWLRYRVSGVSRPPFALAPGEAPGNGPPST